MATLAPKSNRKSRSTLHLQTSQVSLNTNPSHRQQSTLAPPQHQGRSISRNGSSLHIFPSRSNSRLAPGRSNSRLIPGGRSTTARPARSSSRLSISHDDPVYTPAVPPPPPPPTLRDIAIVNHGPIVTQLEQDLIHATSTGDLDAVYECIWKAAECGGLKCASAVVSSLEEGGSGRHAGGSAGGGGGHMGRRNAISPRRWNLSRATTKAIPHPEGEGRRRRASSVGTARFNAKSCNINCRIPFMGTSPLSLVCKSGLPLCAKIANVLLEFGADATDADNYGVTPLHWAAEKGSEVLIQRLIQHLNERFLLAHSKLAGPANERVIQAIGKKDLFGSTPLHFAAVNNRLKVVEALLLAGADPTAVNNDGRKPSDVCSDPDVRSILIEEEKRLMRARMAANQPALLQPAKSTKKKGKRGGKSKGKKSSRPTSASSTGGGSAKSKLKANRSGGKGPVKRVASGSVSLSRDTGLNMGNAKSGSGMVGIGSSGSKSTSRGGSRSGLNEKGKRKSGSKEEERVEIDGYQGSERALASKSKGFVVSAVQNKN